MPWLQRAHQVSAHDSSANFRKIQSADDDLTKIGLCDEDNFKENLSKVYALNSMSSAGHLNTHFKDRKCLKALKYLSEGSTDNFHK